MAQSVDRARIVALFEALRTAFPFLTSTLQHDHPHVDLNLDVPKQPGLTFDVNLNLQEDELHLSAGAFWLEWFPCTDAEVVERYFDAAAGILSGKYRIVEHHARNRAVKAQLQRPTPTGWETIGTWSNLGSLIPGRRHERVLQNIGTA